MALRLASPTFRPLAVNMVVLGGALAAVAGPEMAKQLAPARGVFPPFLANYIGQAGLCGINILAALLVDYERCPQSSPEQHSLAPEAPRPPLRREPKSRTTACGTPSVQPT